MTPRYEWVSVHEASRRLNRSVSTIRRQIESGELVGEREPLARGSTRDRYRVRLDVPATPHDASSSESGDEPPEASEPPQDTPAAITGLLEIVAADRETMERQAETIAALRERAGRAEARVEWLEDEVGAQQSAADAAIIRTARAEAERDAARQTAADLIERLRLAEEEAARLRARRWWHWWPW